MITPNAKKEKISIYSYRLSPIAILLLGSFYFIDCSAEDINLTSQENAQNVEFDESFLSADHPERANLSRFANGSNASPGTYLVGIFVNNTQVAHKSVEFRVMEDQSVVPCLTADILSKISFNEATLPDNAIEAMTEKSQCVALDKIIPGIHTEFDSTEQRVNITIPQIYLKAQVRGSVNPALWDSGIPAFLLSYNSNVYNNQSNGEDSQSFYAGINAGLNIGAWYLRHNGSYNWSSTTGGEYDNINTYLQRDVPVLKGRVIIGESNTDGQLFDTVPFTGIQLSSDERMLPDSQRGYAPEVHGVARTNAKVTVKQNGQVIYEISVPPGPFLINDLYPSGYGGDLNVSIQEADGSEQNFTIPYASVSQLLRPGNHRYSVTAGKLRVDYLADDPMLYQATYQRGLTNALTAYGGVQVNQNYLAVQGGMAVGTSLGAFALDVTQAETRLPQSAGGNSSGQSYRVSYSKNILATDSNISVAAYRFSTQGYMDLMTAMQTREAALHDDNPGTIQRAKNRFSITANQGLGGHWGQFYISGSLENYWGQDGNNKQFQLGYNNRYKSVSYSLNISRSQTAYGQPQTNYFLTLSFPLGSSEKSSQPQINIGYNQDSKGNSAEQATLSGTLGEQNQFGYSASVASNSDGNTSGNISGDYRNSYTTMGASYSAGQGYRSASANMSGSIVTHSGGVTFSPYVADTFALIEAKGAEGASVGNYQGIRVDSHGYALLPSLTPYQINEISIDPEGMSDNIELEETSQHVAPHSGAIVKVKYQTRSGTPVLFTSTHNGEPLPFGAEVFDERNNHIGNVAQGGQLHVRVAEPKGKLKVLWGSADNEYCWITYALLLPTTNQQDALQRINAQCELTTTRPTAAQMLQQSLIPNSSHS